MAEETVTSQGANGDYGCRKINGEIVLNPSTPMERAVLKSYAAARQMQTAVMEYEAGEPVTGKEYESDAHQLAKEAIKEAKSAEVRITQLNPAVVASNEACLLSEMALKTTESKTQRRLMKEARDMSRKAIRDALLAQNELTINSSFYGIYPLNKGKLLTLR